MPMNAPPDSTDAVPAKPEEPSRMPPRLDSRELFRQGRAIEIVHAGRIYTLRLTQLNKLILTA